MTGLWHAPWFQLLCAVVLHICICAVPILRRVHPARFIVMAEKFLEGVLREKMGFELRRAGVVLWLICMLVCAGAGLLLQWISPVFSILLMCSAFSFGQVGIRCRKVLKALAFHDISSARAVIAEFTKQDIDRMTERECVSVTVQYAAHSLCDTVIAPFFWMLVFSLFGCAPVGALLWVCVDTLDSRIGINDPRYTDLGRASARLSDWLGFVPGWLAGWSVVLASAVLRLDFRTAIRVMDRDHKAHTGPNGGWAVAALAGVLGIRLGGDIRMSGVVLHRRSIGDSVNLPGSIDIRRTAAILRTAACGALAITLLLLYFIRL